MKLIPLHNRQGKTIAYAKVDNEDYSFLINMRWCRNSNGRAMTGKSTLMHRVILGLEKGDGKEVDHWNGNPLDNRRANLKITSRAQNSQNVTKRRDAIHSKYRGVGKDTRTGNWTASVRVNGKRFHVGTFKTEIEAAKAASDFRCKVFSNSNEARSVRARQTKRKEMNFVG